MKSRVTLLVTAAVALFYQCALAGSSNVEIILDASGSMAAKIQGRTKMDIAKQAVYDLLLSLPDTTEVAIRTYGHRRKSDCDDIELISPFGKRDLSNFKTVMNLKTVGKTPLAASIIAASKDFAGREGQDNTVILITDGEETCGGDPCAAAKQAHLSGLKVKINVIGFKIEDKERAQLECIAREGGGKYVSANDARELAAATKEVAAPVLAAAPETPPPPPMTANPKDKNILAQSNGGQLLVAPSDSWAAVNDGKEVLTNLHPGEEAVFAFKDEQPATFDNFATLVTEASNWNLKDFELLAGDESPTGSFRSIGTFTAQNAKMLKTPYQQFKFDPVTAKYLKIKVISNYGGYKDLNVSEFRITGETNVKGAAETGAPAPAAKKADTNILAAASGGQLLIAPNDNWSGVNDGKETYLNLRPGEEAVFAFKDEQPATFERFATLVTEAGNWNLKEFELLAGDDSPTGSFRSLGTFTAQNAKMLKSPYQEFKFEPVTAKYLKIKLVSNYGAYNQLNVAEFKVFGQTGAGGGSGKSSAEMKAGGTAGAAKTNILAASAGGQLLLAPEESWAAVIDGKEDLAFFRPAGELVFAFKDEKPATFDTFATLVTETADWNLKDFELLAGDDSPTGSFRSLGNFTVQNVKMLKSPYQEFRFTPVTAKYLKVKINSNHGAYNKLFLGEFKVYNSGAK